MPRNLTSVSLDDGQRMIAAALARAQELGRDVAAAVVDAAGNLIALGRMDAAPPMTTVAAEAKARCAFTLRRRSSEVHDMMAADIPLALTAVVTTGVAISGGGVPIMRDGVCIGALGVAGAPIDEEAALAGIAAVFGG
ncbi:MAG: heme-binding protein [Chloroflexi bacterium]|nr:heme-binding protein [Chloroflexota bacterium]